MKAVRFAAALFLIWITADVLAIPISHAETLRLIPSGSTGWAFSFIFFWIPFAIYMVSTWRGKGSPLLSLVLGIVIAVAPLWAGSEYLNAQMETVRLSSSLDQSQENQLRSKLGFPFIRGLRLNGDELKIPASEHNRKALLEALTSMGLKAEA